MILEGKFAQDPGVLSTTSILGQGNSALLALLGQATQIGARINANQLAQEGNFLAERGRLDTLMETQRQFDITSAQRKHEFNLNTARNVLEFNSNNNIEKQKMAAINNRDIRDTQENNARYDKALGFTLEDRKRAETDRQANLDFINRLTGNNNNSESKYDFIGPVAGGPTNNAFPEDFVGPKAGGPSSYSSDPALLSGFNLANGSQPLLPPPSGFDGSSGTGTGTPSLLSPPVTGFGGIESLLPPPSLGNQGLTTPNTNAETPLVRENVLNKLLNVDSEDLAKSMVEGNVAPTDVIEVARSKTQTADQKLASAANLQALLKTPGMTGEQRFKLTSMVNQLNVQGKTELADAKKLGLSAWKTLTKTDSSTSGSSKLDIIGDFSTPVTKEESEKAKTIIDVLGGADATTLTAGMKEQLAKARILQNRFEKQAVKPVDQEKDPNEIPNADGSVGDNRQAPTTENDENYNTEKVSSLEKLKLLTTADGLFKSANGAKPPATIFLEILKDANRVENSSTVAAPGSFFGTASGGDSDFSASDNLAKIINLPKETINKTLNARDPKTGRTVLESFLDSVANEGNRFAFEKAGLGDIFDPLRYTAKKNNYLDVKGDPVIDAGDEFLKKANLQGTKK